MCFLYPCIIEEGKQVGVRFSIERLWEEVVIVSIFEVSELDSNDTFWMGDSCFEKNSSCVSGSSLAVLDTVRLLVHKLSHESESEEFFDGVYAAIAFCVVSELSSLLISPSIEIIVGSDIVTSGEVLSGGNLTGGFNPGRGRSFGNGGNTPPFLPFLCLSSFDILRASLR